jgi:type II restriction/modification system DNA methylase subunit YeeA
LNPVLEPIESIHLLDAIVDLSDPEHPREPEWPTAEFIVGNPPFLGGKKLRGELGDDYVDAMFEVWDGRVPREADLCCYWFEKARSLIEAKTCKRTGLLATQGIRGGANRRVLERIKGSGDLFFAISDRDWVLEGAAVHVSIIGFDDGSQQERILDSVPMESINADLRGSTDTTSAAPLDSNFGIAYMGDTKGGPFELLDDSATEMLQSPNPTGVPNSNVLVPWVNGKDVTSRSRGRWIVDFGIGMTLEQAVLYEAPFEFVQRFVKPKRARSRSTIREWWSHERPRVEMREALAPLHRFLITLTVSKHRLFAWMTSPTLPDHQLFAFARSDDYFLGVVQSRIHETWARVQGTQVRERESGFRYTPTSCFETFPFPEASKAQSAAIAAAAKELDELRTRWLNPPEWTREETLEFPGSIDGPWARYVHKPNRKGIGTVRYPRLIPRDAPYAAQLARRTLTNLYNQPPAWLDLAHRRLDEAVAAAYGWPADLSESEILARLLELNLSRSASQT